MARTLYLDKGVKIRAHHYKATTNPMASLAGFQMKLDVTGKNIVGTIRHIRSAVEPKPGVTLGRDDIALFVDLDEGYTGDMVDLGCPCGRAHAEVLLKHVVDTIGEPIDPVTAAVHLEVE